MNLEQASLRSKSAIKLCLTGHQCEQLHENRGMLQKVLGADVKADSCQLAGGRKAEPGFLKNVPV
jgi:hypothetical protein